MARGDRKWQSREIVERDRIKFEEQGNAVEGYVTKVRTFTSRYGENTSVEISALVDQETGETKESFFFCNWDLSEKLFNTGSPVKSGDYVRITYIEDRETPQGDMKVFEVLVAQD